VWRHRRHHIVDPCFVGADRFEFRSQLGLAHAAGSDDFDRQLQENAVRSMIFNYRLGSRRSPAVHGITIMVNSLFNGWRFEDAWLGQ